MNLYQWALVWASGVYCGIVFCRLRDNHRRRQERKRESPVAEAEHAKYGHVSSPVAELRRQLPKLPTGYVWELSVITKNGDLWLYLAIIEPMRDNLVYTSNSVNLVKRKEYCSPSLWETYYRQYPQAATSAFYGEIIEPLAAWALRESRKLFGDQRLETEIG